MNKVILMGRLTRDPEVRYTQNGKAVATFTLAVDRRLRRGTDTAQQQTADFIPIVAWDKQAELCGNYLTRGSQLLVEGRMQVRSYEAQDGSKRYVTEVILNEMDFVGKKSDNAGMGNAHMDGNEGFHRASSSSMPAGGAPETFGNPLPADDDIPF